MSALAWVPVRVSRKLRDGWTIAAEQVVTQAGLVAWDVRAEHADGSRVPMGPNHHDEPEAEMARLTRVID